MYLPYGHSRQAALHCYLRACFEPRYKRPDPATKSLVSIAWGLGEWIYPVSSCEGFPLEIHFYGKKRREASKNQWGHLRLAYQFTQKRKDSLLVGLPSYIKIEHGVDHSTPHHPRDCANVKFLWWYKNKVEASSVLERLLENLKVNTVSGLSEGY